MIEIKGIFMCTIRVAVVAIFLTLFFFVPNATGAIGEVLSHQKISDTEGGFTGVLDNFDGFGSSAASLGDLDGDGVSDLAVGAFRDDDGGTNRGAVWVLALNSDGTVKSHRKISDTEGGFTGVLDNADYFGTSIAPLGDLDGDGVVDLAVGAIGDDDGGSGRGAVWVLFLNSDGTVKAHQKISDTEGGFTGVLDDSDSFGVSAASLGDLDGDGVVDLAVGVWGDDDGGLERGAVWVLFLNSDGTVKSHQKISDTVGGFTGVLADSDYFGNSAASLGDLDGDGVTDLAVGAYDADGGGAFGNRGAVWVLFLNSDGTVKAHQKISDTEGGFTGVLDDSDYFGASAASLGDLDGDGVTDLAVGAWLDDDGGGAFGNRGAVWVLFLNSDGTVKAHQKISDTVGGFTGVLDDSDSFGMSTASLGDLDGDGVTDLAVGASNDDDGGTDHGAVWVLFLDGVSTDVISADLTCVPLSGTLPFDTTITVALTNMYATQVRRIAGRVDVTLANGEYFSNYRAGYTNVAASDSYVTSWNTTIPELGSMIGDNEFTLVAEDVTPAPYNQPPYLPAGDTATASCTVTGIAP